MTGTLVSDRSALEADAVDAAAVGRAASSGRHGEKRRRARQVDGARFSAASYVE